MWAIKPAPIWPTDDRRQTLDQQRRFADSRKADTHLDGKYVWPTEKSPTKKSNSFSLRLRLECKQMQTSFVAARRSCRPKIRVSVWVVGKMVVGPMTKSQSTQPK